MGVGAGLLWGLAFVLPGLAQGWSAVSVTAGRYVVYGVTSVLIVWTTTRRNPDLRDLLRSHWRTALVYALTGNVGYYLVLVIAIQGVGAPLASTVVGSIPVVIAVVSNLRQATYSWRHLTASLVLVTVGLAVVNVPYVLDSGTSLSASFMVGLVAALAAVVIWTSYGVSNADFLVNHPDVGGSSWATAVGVLTGPLALLLVPVALLLGPTEGGHVSVSSAADIVTVSLVLGVAVSWVATYLWNDASAKLTTTLAGLLITVETVAGYGYSYLLETRLPPLTELLGFALVIAGVCVTAVLPTTATARSFGRL
jgi:drug/metabolite transporter (DMT)-like permease